MTDHRLGLLSHLAALHLHQLFDMSYSTCRIQMLRATVRTVSDPVATEEAHRIVEPGQTFLRHFVP